MNKLKTAYHEAGHAIVAHFTGCPIESVSIIDDDESLGRCITPLPEGFQPDDQEDGSMEVLESHLAVCLAGAAAREILTGETVELMGNDLDGAIKLMGSLGGNSEQMNAAADEAQRRAKSILEREWAAVEALVGALLERGELDGEQTVAVIEGVR
jgi:ATP-dependent Zn protease